jgi:lactoylglutathione lyase
VQAKPPPTSGWPSPAERLPPTQKHIDFYTKLLGMKLLRSRDIPEDKYSNAFLGYAGEETNFAGAAPPHLGAHADVARRPPAPGLPSALSQHSLGGGQRRAGALRCMKMGAAPRRAHHPGGRWLAGLLIALRAVELTYNYGVDSYDLGEGFGHFGVALPDVYKACEQIKAGGGTVRRCGGGGVPRCGAPSGGVSRQQHPPAPAAAWWG